MTIETPRRQAPPDGIRREATQDAAQRPILSEAAQLAATPRGVGAVLTQHRRVLVPTGVAVALSIAALFSVYFWYQNRYYITTDNASVSGALAQVTSPNAGRIFELRHDVGDVVARQEALTVVDLPISTTLPLGGSRSTFLDARDRLMEVPSPVDGVVIARNVNVGDTVTANQTLFTVVDTRNLWVVANIEETKVGRVEPGQPVEVYLDALHRSFDGRVEAIVPATMSTFSLLPTQNAGGNFTKVVQLVPVKIAIRYEDAALIVGASASVRIHLQ